MRTLELRHLRYFVAVAEELHFTRAAERLRIAQPGLSQQIKALERSVGVELFTRDRHGVELTEAGRALLGHARQVLELTERAVESARVAATTRMGPLKVGTSAIGITPVANDVLMEFRARFPNVDVEILPGFVPQAIERLTRRALDLAIVFVPFESPQGLRYLRLDSVELVVVLPEGHRLTALERVPRSELLKEPLLEGPRSANPLMTDHIHRVLFGEVAHPQLVEAADISETRRLLLVAEGRGIAVSASSTVLGLHIPRIVYRRMEEPEPVIECGVVWYETLTSPLAPSFIQVARDVVAERRARAST
jgi:DNA-binding transcriptional LysR family regulator